MSNLTLELNVSFARNLVNVNLITKMNVYTVVSIRGDDTRKKQKVKTVVDHSGGSNPTWNHAVKFLVDERLALDGSLTLIMRLKSRRVLGSKDIGRVNVPVLELLNSIMPLANGDGNGQSMKLMTYQVRSSSGKRSGSLTFSYRFKPDSPAIVNRSSVATGDLSLTANPLSQIEHSPSGPPELSSEHPKLTQPPYQKHHAVAESRDDPLPISYGAVLTEEPYFWSSPCDKSGHTCNHASPPPSHQEYGPYDYALPSPAGYGYRSPTYQQLKGIGLEVETGLLVGLMMGDIVSDVVKCFDL